MNAQEIEGGWHDLRGALKQKWAELTDDDLLHAEGELEQLVGRIQARTGEAREAIQDALREIGL